MNKLKFIVGLLIIYIGLLFIPMGIFGLPLKTALIGNTAICVFFLIMAAGFSLLFGTTDTGDI